MIFFFYTDLLYFDNRKKVIKIKVVFLLFENNIKTLKVNHFLNDIDIN